MAIMVASSRSLPCMDSQSELDFSAVIAPDMLRTQTAMVRRVRRGQISRSGISAGQAFDCRLSHSQRPAGDNFRGEECHITRVWAIGDWPPVSPQPSPFQFLWRGVPGQSLF